MNPISSKTEKNVTEDRGPKLWWTEFVTAITQYIGIKILIIIFFLVIVGIGLIVLSHKKAETNVWFYIMREIGKVLGITAIVSGGVKWYISRHSSVLDRVADKFLENQLSENYKELRAQVLSQTEAICGSASSLVAMREADIEKIYRNRAEASPAIKAALEDENVTEIRISGISLNDFVRDERTELQSAWRTIESRLLNESQENNNTKGKSKLNVKVLLIDPSSKGAFLRSQAEGQEDKESRLHEDVNITMKDLHTGKVNFEVRIYRLAPILYLVWTPSTAFVQQYYFRPRHRDAGVNAVVNQYCSKRPSELRPHSIHEELAFHFNWIWDRASIPLDEYLDKHSQGTATASREAGISNMFYDLELSKKRIIYLLTCPKNSRIWLKGISLKSFFRYGDLFDALTKASKTPRADIRILLMDPDCEQAKIRSFREFRIAHEDAKFSDFKPNQRKEQRLYKDTTESIRQIETFLDECSKLTNGANIQIKLFSSSPEAFLLITDTSALIEQYHYGKIGPVVDGSISGKILGGDIPVIEYEKTVKHKNDGLKDPYRIFSDHFNFVFEHFSVDIHTWLKKKKRKSES